MPRSIRNIRLDNQLDRVDMAKLRGNRYSELCSQWNEVFVIRHKKYPDKVAELRAISFVHACKLIGWRLRHVELVNRYEVE